MLATFVIFFREALEASLIVGILLAYLDRRGWPEGKRAVWAGTIGAVVVDLAVALATYRIIQSYSGSRVQTILEGTTYLVATGILTGMSFWMKRQAGRIRGELEAAVRAALTRGSAVALGALAAVTVGREGLETAFFTLAIAFHASGGALALGAALGLAAGVLVTASISRLGRRVPLAVFFNVLGVLLLIFAAGLLADAVQDFQGLGWVPVFGQAVWHSARLLSESSALGDILHTFVGYADAPSRLQLGAYLAFLIASVWAYRRPAGRRSA